MLRKFIAAISAAVLSVLTWGGFNIALGNINNPAAAIIITGITQITCATNGGIVWNNGGVIDCGTPTISSGNIVLASGKAITLSGSNAQFQAGGGNNAGFTWPNTALFNITSTVVSARSIGNAASTPLSGAYLWAAGPGNSLGGTPYTIASTLSAAGSKGRIAMISDGDAGLAWGATAINSGGGATVYLVWDNGTNWTVIGK